MENLLAGLIVDFFYSWIRRADGGDKLDIMETGGGSLNNRQLSDLWIELYRFVVSKYFTCGWLAVFMPIITNCNGSVLILGVFIAINIYSLEVNK